MKFITAIIKPARLDAVQEALVSDGFQGMTVSEVKGFGRQRGQTSIYRGTEYTTLLVPKVKVEVAVSDDAVDKAIDTIATAAGTGSIGDGKIFVLDLLQAKRIRTGETDVDAIQI